MLVKRVTNRFCFMLISCYYIYYRKFSKSQLSTLSTSRHVMNEIQATGKALVVGHYFFRCSQYLLYCDDVSTLFGILSLLKHGQLNTDSNIITYTKLPDCACCWSTFHIILFLNLY